MTNGNDPATIRDLARLQELLCIKIQELKTLRDVDKEAAQKALDIATAELSRRMESLNHEAARIRDIEAKTITREAHTLTLTPLEDRVVKLENEAATLRGKADQKAVNVNSIMGGIALLLSLISLLIKIL